VNIFIVEDDISIVEVLKKIISDRGLGNVIDYSLNGKDAIEKIKEFLPEIVLIDLFLP
jgi:two-component system response regulator YcbB